MQERNDRHDSDVDKLHAVMEVAIRLQQSAAVAIAGLQETTKTFKLEAAQALRHIDVVTTKLPSEVSSAVTTQLEEAAQAAANRMTVKWKDANKAAEVAAATFRQASEDLHRRVMFWFGLGGFLGVVVGATVAVGSVWLFVR
ncbi:hypothetical protein ACVNIS_11450 [Sphaerotilaceae bacterium SBD11-9]